MEVDAEAGLRSGARLLVNTLTVTDQPEEPPTNNHDDAVEELTGKMYALPLYFQFRFTGGLLV